MKDEWSVGSKEWREGREWRRAVIRIIKGKSLFDGSEEVVRKDWRGCSGRSEEVVRRDGRSEW